MSKIINNIQVFKSKPKNIKMHFFQRTGLWLNKQINDIKVKGLKIIFFKIILLFRLIFYFFISSIILLIIRLISPLILIKLSSLDMGRIGEYKVIWFLKLKNLKKIQTKKTIYIFFLRNSTNYTNKQWLKMHKKKITILPIPMLKYVLILNRLFSGYEKHELPNFNSLTTPKGAKNNYYYIKNLGTKTLNELVKSKDSVFSFSKKEEEIGQSYLKAIGAKEYKFICFHSRDKAFLNKNAPNRNWDYHDYRDSNIFNYLHSMEEITKRNNYFCFRMGSTVQDKISVLNERIIDYANSKNRSDFLDIFLGSKCRFFLCSQTGLAIVPETFNRPVVYVNSSNLSLNNTFSNNSLFIPKKHFSLKKNRLLTFKEFIDSGLDIHSTSKRFEDLNIKLIENTPEEITDVVMEMENRLKGSWKTDKEDEELQEKFWGIFKHTFLKSSSFRLGSKFLKQNRELLN